MRAAESFDVRARRMFNGMGVYTGEKMFAYLSGEDIGLKLSPEDLAEAMKLPGAGPVTAEANADPMPQYVRMPKDVLDNLESFNVWVEKSAAYARCRAVMH